MIDIKDRKSIKEVGLKIIFWEIEDILYALKLRDINNNELFYVLLSEDEDGRSNRPLILETLGKGKKSVISKLGLDLTDKELLELEKFISKTNTIPERVFYNNFGFHENSRGDMCFNGAELVPMGYISTKKKQKDYTFDTVEPPKFIERIQNCVESDEGELLFSTDRTLLKNKHDENVEETSLDYAIDFYRREVTTKGMKLAVATGFASPIVQLIGQSPILLNLYGETSKGKTSTSLLISSLFSSADDPRLMVDFDRTLQSLEKHLESFKGVPLVVDDASTSKDKEPVGSDFVYTLAKGKGRSRLDVRDGFTATMPGEWANSIIMSSELTILGYCDPKKAGVLRRIIEFRVAETADKTLTINSKHADRIEEFTRKNYGQLGTAFIKKISENYEDEVAIWELFKQEQEQLIKLAKEPDEMAKLAKVQIDSEVDEDLPSRLSGYIKMVTPILMAVYILKEHMSLDFNIEEIRSTLLDLFEEGSSILGSKLKSKAVGSGV